MRTETITERLRREWHDIAELRTRCENHGVAFDDVDAYNDARVALVAHLDAWDDRKRPSPSAILTRWARLRGLRGTFYGCAKKPLTRGGGAELAVELAPCCDSETDHIVTVYRVHTVRERTRLCGAEVDSRAEAITLATALMGLLL